jgi:hypothetical protein
LYQYGTKWVCTARDVPGTKTSGRNGKKWKVENSGTTRFLQAAVPSAFAFFYSAESKPTAFFSPTFEKC